ncbi:MAG: response regulator transcription factor [Lachnospiraceae bacterium]
MKRILIIEDDHLIAELERDYLAAQGMEADIAADGQTGLELFSQNEYGAVVLDLMLPVRDGYEICKEIRANSNVPILMVTAKKEDIDKIRGLGLGADDYIVKPFSPPELVARVKAHIHIHELLASKSSNECIQVRNLKIYTNAYRVYKEDKETELTSREFKLLLFLAENPNIVFSKEILFDRIWGMDAVGDLSTVTVHINKIRDKIEDSPSKPALIQTVGGVGYRFQPS